MNYVIAFMDSLSIVGLLVSTYMLIYSLSKDRRYNTVTGEKFYVQNSGRMKLVLSMVICLSWVIASFGVVS